MDVLSAMAQHAKGAVALADGDARSAIHPLRRAHEVWQRVGAPYFSARIRLLLARAFRALGDEDGAALELDAAERCSSNLAPHPTCARPMRWPRLRRPRPPDPHLTRTG